MRAPLEPANGSETFPSVLARMGPAKLGQFLRPGAGFRVRFGGPAVEMERDAKDKRCYHFPGTQVVARVSIELSAEHGVAVQRVVLSNEGDEPSPGIDLLDVLHLPLAVRLVDAPRAWSFGGGTTDGFYPTRAYREHEVCFGQARDWDPQHAPFTRWWIGKRWFTLTSGPGDSIAGDHLPLIQTVWKAGDEEIGLWAALEWAGKWELQMGTMQDWQFLLRGGPTVRKMVLQPGETLQLPAVHVGAFGGTKTAAEDGHNSIRRYIANVISPDVEGRRPWPYVAYHHWYGIFEDFTESLLRKQVDRAAELGIEYFELDAGWYALPPGGTFYYQGIGNWERVDQSKFPQGLDPFADYVRSKGMRFGLWFEPERGRAGSDWVTRHPDWFWSDNGVNFQLDLTRGDVQDALIGMLSGWVARLDVRWLRWDGAMPVIPFWNAVDPTGKVQFAYLEGVYRVIDTLLERHPNLLIDQCVGPTSRFDVSGLRRAGTAVPHDHGEDPHICRLVQTSGARILPANLMNTSILVGEEDGDETVGPLNLMSRMAGAISLSGHIANWSGKQTRMVRRYLDGFRTYRHLLMQDFYPLTPSPQTEADWDVAEFVDPETTEAVILAYRVRGDRERQRVYPKGLDAATTYVIQDPFSSREPSRATGRALMEKGLRLSLNPDSAKVRHLRPIRQGEQHANAT